MQGSVVRSWLLELAGRAFKANGQDLEHLKGYRRGFRRGSLDRPGGDRPRRPGAGHHVLAADPVPVAPGRLVRRQGARRAPQRVRRSRRQDRVATDGRDPAAEADEDHEGQDPAPLVAPSDQPIPAQPAPRPKDAPRTMKDLRLARAGKRASRAKPVENVLREGLRLARIPDPSILVLFGATGDLAHRKVIPALYHLWRTDLLPHEFRVVAIGRRPFDDETFRAGIRDLAREVQPDPAARRGRLALVRGADLATSTSTSRTRPGFDGLATRLDEIDDGARDARQPPVLPRHPAVAVRRDRRPSSGASGSTTSATTAAGGGSSSRSRSGTTSTRRSGSTARSARSSASRRSTASTTTWARRRSATCWSSGSATASSSRSGTAATSTTCRSPWPSRSASRTAARSTRRPARRATSSRTTCSSWSAWSRWSRRRRSRPTPCATRRSRSCARSRATRSTPRRTSCAASTARAGWRPPRCPGYRQETDVDPGSETETFVAARLTIDDWRWSGVPFYVRTGKRLPKRATEIAIQYREVPHRLFKDAGVDARREPAGDPDPARRGDHAALRGQGARASGWTSGR